MRNRKISVRMKTVNNMSMRDKKQENTSKNVIAAVERER